MARTARPSSALARPRCAACDHSFEWGEATVDPGTAGTGFAARPPELHCPHCDATVARWHLDLVSDHASWVWAHGQAHGQGPGEHRAQLPADPPHRWGLLPEQRGPERSREDDDAIVP